MRASPTACLALAFLVLVAIPVFGQDVSDELDGGARCESLPPEDGCIEAQEEFFDRNGTRLSRSRIATPEGTCDDAKDCAKKAKKKCKKGKHGAAVLVEINSTDTKCSYKCADGHTGAIICPPSDQVAAEDSDSALTCEIVRPPQEGCIDVEEDVTLPGAADDLHYSHYDITELGVFSINDALITATGYDGAIFRTVVPQGTCDDVEDCAKKANKSCREMGQGKAKTATVSVDEDSCSYTCTGGAQGEVVCAKKKK
jgi:hypothetical protein